MTYKNRELPVYSLYIHPFDLDQLRNPLRPYDDPVPAQLKTDRMEFVIRMNFRGHHTRNLPKRSYHIHFIKPRRLDGSREFHLNAEYNDPSMIRNKLSLDLFQSFGTLAPTSQFIRININDQYQGVYLRLESVDDLFLKKRDLPLGAIYYAVNNNANFSLISRITNDAKNSLMDGYQCKCGTIFDDECLIDFINMINNTPPDEFASKISNYLSVDRYLRWLAIAVCTQNMDGFVKNYALYRNPHTQLFEIIPWDYDATFGRDWNGEIMEFDTVPLEGYNTLTKKLLEVPEFRNLYRRLMEELLDTLFTPAFLEPKILDLTQSLRPHLQFDPYKSTQLDQFDVEPEFILQFIKDRNQFLRNHLKDLD